MKMNLDIAVFRAKITSITDFTKLQQEHNAIDQAQRHLFETRPDLSNPKELANYWKTDSELIMKRDFVNRRMIEIVQR